jgi:hypothetical protein
MRSQPAVALLSNGSYGVMITSAGAGYSSWRDLDVTRWREDATRDCWGQFYYVRDVSDNSLWSIGLQPLCQAADEADFDFHADRVEFRRRDGDVETRCAVCVVPDVDAEIRAVTLVNHGLRHREFELTSYAEVCLNDRRADQAHGAARPTMSIGAGSEPSSCGAPWRRTPGTAGGTVGPISTTALPWDPLKTMSAKSTPFHTTRHGLNRRWTRFKNDWCVAATN